jgi:hypothetical protein
MLSDRKIKRFIGRIIWNFAETNHIALRRFAPTVFGWMIGAKKKKHHEQKTS